MDYCRTLWRSDHEVRLSSPPTTTTTHPRHLAQRSNSALLTVPHPQTHTFSESSWQELFKDGNVTQIQWQWQWQIRWQRQRQWQRQRDWKLHIWQSHAPKPIHFLKARDKSYSKTATWHKYKDNDNYKYEDKDKDKDEDAKTIPGTLTVCYIFGILMTRPVQPSTAQNSLARCSNVFKLVQNLFKRVQMCSNLFKTCSNVFKCVQMCSNLLKTCSNKFKCV